jgi:mannopine transport system ATP-binding protein
MTMGVIFAWAWSGAVRGEAISLRGLHKAYCALPVVRDVSFEIAAGEFVSLLGPSGSGKTTILMMIAGFETPNDGQIVIGERDITYLAPNRRNVGMVFQRYALFPHMSVAQNVAFPLKMRGVAKREIPERVARILDLVQLGAYAQRYPQQLSGGQQQRVAVARALVFEPPVLLMDEPLSALDKKLRESMQFEIKSLQQRLGVTVIYVTHDQEEAMTLSDRVAVIDRGELVQIGAPADLYQRPRTPFVADFIGRMNFLDGEYLGSDEARCGRARCRGGAADGAAPERLGRAVYGGRAGVRRRAAGASAPGSCR